MRRTKVIQFEKNEKDNGKEQVRQILKNGILNGMCVEKLIQIAEIGLCGNVEVMTGLCGTSHYFNRMEYVKAANEEECDIINYYFEEEEDIIASTTISIEQIEEISGCVNEDNPDNVLDINIVMADGSGITINIIY